MRLEDIKVTCYKSVFDTIGKETDLATFFDCETDEEANKNLDLVEELRRSNNKERRDEIKRMLPQVCVSGTFGTPRSKTTLKQHSGLICVDIDRHDNQHLNDVQFARIGVLLQKFPHTLFLNHSVGGVGWFCLIPITHPEKHKEQFEALSFYFLNKLKLQIDIAYINVAQMRCWSPLLPCEELPNGYYYNQDAIPFTKCAIPEPQRPIRQYDGTDATLRRVEALVRICERTNTDLTEQYDTWYKIGASLSSLGDVGKDFFFRLSRLSAKYTNDRDLETKWRGVQRLKIDIGYLFNVAKNNNILISQD